MVKILDNFLDNDYLKQLQLIIPNLGYKPHTSEPTNNLNAKFMNSVGDGYWPNTDSFNYMVEKISNLPYIKNVEFLRMYVNLHPSGENHGGDFHEDDGMITALFYPMVWDKTYGGGTEFKSGDIVDYVENRLVLFNSFDTHRGMEHSNAKMFRYTVAFKMNAFWKGI